jgi:hypothetical protein
MRKRSESFYARTEDEFMVVYYFLNIRLLKKGTKENPNGLEYLQFLIMIKMIKMSWVSREKEYLQVINMKKNLIPMMIWMSWESKRVLL